jgi:hypothetical protein
VRGDVRPGLLLIPTDTIFRTACRRSRSRTAVFVTESRVIDGYRSSVERITIRRRDGASLQFLHDPSAAVTNLQESRMRNDRVGHRSPLNRSTSFVSTQPPADRHGLESLFNARSTVVSADLDVMVMRSARRTAGVPAHATGTCRPGVAASPNDQQEMAIAVLRECLSSDAGSTDPSCALRSVAEVGLSARTRERRGTARTLAGSVRYDQHPLYRNRRLSGWAARKCRFRRYYSSLPRTASCAACRSPTTRRITRVVMGASARLLVQLLLHGDPIAALH